MKLQVAAIGQDEYWLNAIQKATTGWPENPITVKCAGGLLRCIARLPKPSASIVLLVDASGQGNMEQVVAGLRARGWKYVIVVAADPSAKEATAVLRANLGYDYWEKTYDEEVIQKRIKACFDEITVELPLITAKHNRL